MRNDFFGPDLAGFIGLAERAAETLVERRFVAFGAGVETSSRASIMVISCRLFVDVDLGSFKRDGNPPGFQNTDFSKKN
jgi:hypothetical protein